MKKFLKVILVIFILIAVFLLWVLKTVDYTPYFETDYYRTTKSRLDSLANQSHNTSGAVMIGVGKQSITPILQATADDPEKGAFAEIPLAGYGSRKGAPATGIHDSLFVKAIAIRVKDKTMVFVGSDLLIMPPEVSKLSDDLVFKSSGLTRANMFY